MILASALVGWLLCLSLGVPVSALIQNDTRPDNDPVLIMLYTQLIALLKQELALLTHQPITVPVTEIKPNELSCPVYSISCPTGYIALPSGNGANGCALTPVCTLINQPSSLPALYIKPDVHILPDGTKSPFPVQLSQITSDLLPTLPNGTTDVQLTFYWSQLCPTSPNSCDFSIIDNALSYWQAHGKHVILAVGTISYLTKTGVNADGTPQFVSATPSWVMNSVQTFALSAKVIGQMKVGSGAQYPLTTTTFPLNWDPRFVADIEQLVGMLATRYDGNTTISHMEMALGLNTEDLALQATPGLSISNWVTGFTQPIVNTYIADFTKTPLEYDSAWLGYLYRHFPDAASQQTLDAFFNTITSHHILYSYEGLQSDALTQIALSKTLPNSSNAASSYALLARAQAAGDTISFESGGALSSPAMKDLVPIVSVIKTFKPVRIGWFNPNTNFTNPQTAQLLNMLGY
jgi:hypothetical protein